MKINRWNPCQITDAIFYVSSYSHGMAEGTLLHPRLEEPKEIRSIPQLIVELNDILNREDVPVQKQVFSAAAAKENCIATFRIQVLFMEHYTWQGRLVWEERKIEAAFQSVLELILIIDEILSE